MWWMRETLPECNRRVGPVTAHDISLPLSLIGRFIAEATGIVAGLGAGLRINCFGHVGDGNLHYNVFPPEGGRVADCRALAGPMRMAIHDLVHARGGSISAEHGIGRLNLAANLGSKSEVEIDLMRKIKRALDPENLMNPGRVVPDSSRPG